MAKENFVFIVGQLLRKPQILTDEEGNAIRGTCMVTTLRRPKNKKNTPETPVWDSPIVMTGNRKMIEQMKSLEVYDFVEVKGTVTTKEVKKSAICQYCGEKTTTKGIMTFITPTFIGKRCSANSRTAGFPYLKEHAEISNIAKIIGRVCVLPDLYTNSDNVDCCQYQIAVNRKFYIEGTGLVDRTDYPWVKTFGDMARENKQVLQVGSLVFLDASIRTRKFSRDITCTKCGKINEKDEVVLEILPYSVEYLQNCNLPESTRETGENVGDNGGDEV